MTRSTRSLLTVSFVTLFASALESQTVRGTILGTVTDSTGAGIRGARVAARQIATDLTRSELTNDTGEYSLTQLPLGPYLVTVEQAGFKKTAADTVCLAARFLN